MGTEAQGHQGSCFRLCVYQMPLALARCWNKEVTKATNPCTTTTSKGFQVIGKYRYRSMSKKV